MTAPDIVAIREPEGRHTGYEDVCSRIDRRRTHCVEVGFGARYVDRFVR
jgi:2,4'-dihydroxyacetophenone dioxygenase